MVEANSLCPFWIVRVQLMRSLGQEQLRILPGPDWSRPRRTKSKICLWLRPGGLFDWVFALAAATAGLGAKPRQQTTGTAQVAVHTVNPVQVSDW